MTPVTGNTVVSKEAIVNDLSLAASMLAFTIVIYILSYDYNEYGILVFCGTICAVIVEVLGKKHIIKSTGEGMSFIDQAVVTMFIAAFIILASIFVGSYLYGYEYYTTFFLMVLFCVDLIFIIVDKAPFWPITKILMVVSTIIFACVFVDWNYLYDVTVVYYTMVIWQVILLCIYVNFDTLEVISHKLHLMKHGGKVVMDRIFKRFAVICFSILIILWAIATITGKTSVDFVGWFPTYDIFSLSHEEYFTIATWAFLGVAWFVWAYQCYHLKIPEKVKLIFLLIAVCCTLWSFESVFMMTENVYGDALYLFGEWGVVVAMVVLAFHLHETGYTFWGMICIIWVTFSMSVPPLIWGYEGWDLFITMGDYSFFMILDFILCRRYLTGGEPVI